MAAHQAPLSLGFSRQEHCSGLTFPLHLWVRPRYFRVCSGGRIVQSRWRITILREWCGKQHTDKLGQALTFDIHVTLRTSLVSLAFRLDLDFWTRREGDLVVSEFLSITPKSLGLNQGISPFQLLHSRAFQDVLWWEELEAFGESLSSAPVQMSLPFSIPNYFTHWLSISLRVKPT